MSRLGATHLPVDADDALAGGRFPWEHRDPFDRVLAAQAVRRGLSLVTRDAAFADLPGLSTTW